MTEFEKTMKELQSVLDKVSILSEELTDEQAEIIWKIDNLVGEGIYPNE
jgi:hypothetical protein